MYTICTPDGLCQTITATCVPPLQFQCTSLQPLQCGCVDATPAPQPVPRPDPLQWRTAWGLPLGIAPAQCALQVSYPNNNPSDVQAVAPVGCDQAGIELALAVLLARLMGGK